MKIKTKNNKLVFAIMFVVILVLLGTNDKVINFYKQLKIRNLGSHSPKVSIENTCDEQNSLEKAKLCTYLIESDLGHGSGFSIEKGFLVTNKHVIEGAKTLFTWIDGVKQPLSVWGYSDNEDMAVLKVGIDTPTCIWADSRQITL